MIGTMFPHKPQQIIDAMERLKYAVFAAEYDLNLVGIRSADLNANTFNDWLCVFHYRKFTGTWAFYPMQCSTDPGLYWRKNPEAAKGVGAIVPGQYRGLWQLGMHQGKYPALVQCGPVKLYRDSNKNETLDLDPAKTDVGVFGINLHRAKAEAGASANVDKWSAGCQVLAAAEDLDLILHLVALQKQTHGSDKVSYTLLNQTDLK